MKKNTRLENRALKVLILEDSLQDMELMVAQLSAAGYQLDVTHAENKDQFTEALKKKCYDIILADFTLPDINAFDALEIRQKQCPKVPFICVSGSIGEELAIDLLKKGADDYVLKDRPQRLSFAVKNALAAAEENAAHALDIRKLEESESRFRQVAQTAQEWIWEVDTNGLYTYASPVIESLLGYTPDEVVGKKYFYDFFIPEERDELKKMIFEGIAKKEVFINFEITNVHKNGSRVIVSTSGSPILDVAGNLTGYRGVDEDITERKRAEELLRLQAYIIDNSPIAAAYHDKELNMIWANNAYQKATGLSLEEIKGRKCYQVWNLSKPCRDCPVITAMEKGQNAEYELTPHNQDHWPETQGHWLSQAAPVRDNQGAIIGAIEFAIDITERNRAEQALLAKMDELERFHKLTVGRELTMVELKKEVNNLLKKLGEDPKYKIVE